MKEEIWLPVVDWENLYEVSDHGRVRSLDRMVNAAHGSEQFRKGKIFKPYVQNKGYLLVTLRDGKRNRKKYMLVHRLVALAFIPNPNSLPTVNHLDQNPKNNRVENLEWATQQYNVTYNDAHIIRGKKLMKVVYQYDMDMNFIKVWESSSTAQKEGDFDNATINKVANGQRKQHKGFIWSFEPLHKE